MSGIMKSFEQSVGYYRPPRWGPFVKLTTYWFQEPVCGLHLGLQHHQPRYPTPEAPPSHNVGSTSKVSTSWQTEQMHEARVYLLLHKNHQQWAIPWGAFSSPAFFSPHWNHLWNSWVHRWHHYHWSDPQQWWWRCIGRFSGAFKTTWSVICSTLWRWQWITREH